MEQYKNPVKLPPFTVKNVCATLSQTVDWGLLNLNIPNTWFITKGRGITILIIDTGCPVTKSNGEIIVHPDLQGCIDVSKCKSFIDTEGIEDLQGHSSHCCGIVGARDNSLGCVGYAPECTIVTYKGLDKNGSGSMDQISAALEYAADILKPDIVSMSLGSTTPDSKMHQAIKRLFDMNIPVIAAGGNGGRAEGVNYPGNYEEVITIGAYDVNDKIAYFSAVGEGIDFAFPGVEVYSTYLNNGYAKLSGTSMATPAAAGVVALLLAKHKKQEIETGMNDCKTVDQIKEHLKKYSVDHGKIGKDSEFGYGIVDVSKMIISSDYVTTPTTTTNLLPPAKKTIWERFTNWLFRRK